MVTLGVDSHCWKIRKLSRKVKREVRSLSESQADRAKPGGEGSVENDRIASILRKVEMTGVDVSGDAGDGVDTTTDTEEGREMGEDVRLKNRESSVTSGAVGDFNRRIRSVRLPQTMLS